MAVSNIEAIANIGANLGEIAGVAGGGIWILGSWIPALNKCPRYSRRMLLIGAILLTARLLAPVAVNYFQPISPICSAIVSWIFCIPIVMYAFKAYMLPADISSETGHPHGGGIFALALFGIVCPLHLTWYIALFMATKFVAMNGKASIPEGAQKSEANDQL